MAVLSRSIGLHGRLTGLSRGGINCRGCWDSIHLKKAEFSLPTSNTHIFASRRSSVVEQLIRNQQVGGSIPLAGSSLINHLRMFHLFR